MGVQARLKIKKIYRNAPKKSIVFKLKLSNFSLFTKMLYTLFCLKIEILFLKLLI